MKLKVLKGKFPLYTNRLTISMLEENGIEEYSQELVKDYFVEYLENKKILTLTSNEIKYKLGLLVSSYSSNKEFIYEVRLLVKKKGSNETYGGITLMPQLNGTKIELSYWVKPEYQGRGIATEALLGTIEFIRDNIKNIDGVTLEIQEINTASIKIAEKCKFIKHSTKEGKVCNIVEYGIDWGSKNGWVEDNNN